MFGLRSTREPGFTLPILFNIFNRPAETNRVFNVIRKIRPQKLFIKADGPRRDVPDDRKNCARARKIVDQIDWDCDLYTLFYDVNLGCRISMSSGIDWFFSKVDEGIILEDDCLPEATFFYFCEELLARYRDEERVMMISGNNFHSGHQWGSDSYFFSRHSHIWGWATWRRAWLHYDVGMHNLPTLKRDRVFNRLLPDEREARYWLRNFQIVYDGSLNTWDYQWFYTMLLHNGLSIIPNVNLVSNIGYSDKASHTRNKGDKLANIKTYPLKITSHPTEIAAIEPADRFISNYVFGIDL